VKCKGQATYMQAICQSFLLMPHISAPSFCLATNLNLLST
jgi:hypothetical protein